MALLAGLDARAARRLSLRTPLCLFGHPLSPKGHSDDSLAISIPLQKRFHVDRTAGRHFHHRAAGFIDRAGGSIVAPGSPQSGMY